MKSVDSLFLGLFARIESIGGWVALLQLRYESSQVGDFVSRSLLPGVVVRMVDRDPAVEALPA